MKKKILIPLISTLLVSVSGCNKNNKQNDSSSITSDTKKDISASDVNYEYSKHDNIHIIDSKDTSSYFVLNKKSDYKIVITDEDSDYYKFAINELHDFIYQATGVSLEIINDDASLDKEGKYIYLGNTLNAKELGYNDKVKEYNNTSSYIIRTNSNATYLVGFSNFGNLYAVYKFLNLYFNYETYASSEIKIDENIYTINFKNISVDDVPDFEYRQTTHGEENYNVTFQRRMHMQSEDDLIISVNGETFHNYLNLIPYSKYGKTHPEWFNSAKTNLNLVQLDENGNSVIDEELLLEVFNNIKPYIEANKEQVLVGYTQEDNAAWGDNDATNNNYTKYGVHSVESAEFTSRLATLIQDWLNEVDPDRKLMVFDFGYSHTFDAPATINQDGTVSLMKDGIKLPSNGAILFCTFDSNDYYPLTDSINIDTFNNTKKWSAVTDHLMTWNYYTNFHNFFLPVDCFNSLAANNRYFYENNVCYLYNQFGHTQPMGSDWYTLKEYLAAKLAWNVDYNVNDLYEEFFDNYFKDVSDEMFDFFLDERDWFSKLANQDSSLVLLRKNNNYSKEYWPSALLKKWLNNFDNCIEKIDYLKSKDYDTYSKLYNRIIAERITILYLYINLYENEMTEELYNSYHTTLINDCLKVGFTRASEDDYTIANV